MIKPIPGYLQYWITDDGEIYNRKTMERIKGAPRRPGQRSSVRLYINGYRSSSLQIDRLVFMTFKPKEYDPELYCEHIDGNVENNNINNLRMVEKDPHTNIKSKMENNPIFIKCEHESGEVMHLIGYQSMADMLGVTLNTCYKLVYTGKRHKSGWRFEKELSQDSCS